MSLKFSLLFSSSDECYVRHPSTLLACYLPYYELTNMAS
jgi:hypothetical protein